MSRSVYEQELRQTLRQTSEGETLGTRDRIDNKHTRGLCMVRAWEQVIGEARLIQHILRLIQRISHHLVLKKQMVVDSATPGRITRPNPLQNSVQEIHSLFKKYTSKHTETTLQLLKLIENS